MDVSNDIDSAILDLLQENGRLSNRAIARQLGVSEGMVRKRLKRMEASGAARFGLVTDVSVFGYNTNAWIRLSVESRHLQSLVASLAELPEVAVLTVTTGRYDVMAYVHATDRNSLHRFIQTKIMFRAGVMDVDVRETREVTLYRDEYVVLASETP